MNLLPLNEIKSKLQTGVLTEKQVSEDMNLPMIDEIILK